MVVYKQYHTNVAGCQMRTKNNVHSISITRPNDRTRCAHRDDAVSAAHCLECASPKWMNLRTWIVWEIWYRRLTDQSPAYPGPPVAGGRAGGLDGKVNWSTAPVKG